MGDESTEFLSILEALSGREVDFIIVGGFAAVVLGVPVATFDVDIVHARGHQNLVRLVDALQDLEACYRLPSDRRMVPDTAHLMTSGHHLLRTKHGPLDVLGTIGRSRDYESLIPYTVEVVVRGRTYRILDLEHQIEVKQELGHAKDRLMLPILREALERWKTRS